MLTRMVSISWPSDPPALPSQSAGITGVSHHTRPHYSFMEKPCHEQPCHGPLERPISKKTKPERFQLYSLLQMPNGGRVVNIEFFGNFSCSCKRIHLLWLLSIVHCQLPMAGHCTSSSRLSSPWQYFLNQYCTVCSLVFLGQMHYWCCELFLCFTTHFELE